MKRYKYLIFDLDDTLLDFQDTERKALEKLFNQYEIPFSNESIKEYQSINKNLWTRLENGEISKEEVLSQRFETFFKLYNKSISGQTVENHYREYLNLGHKLIPNALTCLQELKQMGFVIFAGTNGVGKTQRMRLKDSNLIGLFDDIFISEEVGFEKPDPKFFKAIFNKYKNMNSRNTLMIGDSLSSDIQGACNIGIDSVWFNPLNKPRTNIDPTYQISSLNQLIEFLYEID